MNRLIPRLLILSAIVLFVGNVPAARAQTMTAVDVERLRDASADAERELDQLRSRDAQLATRLSRELEGLKDETTYLKVKLGKNEAVSRTEYFDLRDRIDAIRASARKGSEVPPANAPSTAPPARREASSASSMDVPEGTELDVRLTNRLSSETAAVEDRVEATTAVALESGNRTIIPAGSMLRGTVRSVTRASRLERKGSLTVDFEQITVRGRSYPITATVTQALESEGIKGETGKIGGAAGVGAIIGGILGGLKGALAGILIGGGGMVAATDGKDVDLPPGAVLRVRIDSGIDLR